MFNYISLHTSFEPKQCCCQALTLFGVRQMRARSKIPSGPNKDMTAFLQSLCSAVILQLSGRLQPCYSIYTETF